MRTSKQQKRRKTVFIIVAAVIIATMAFAYIIPLQAMASTDPVIPTPPPDYGTDYDYDDSTLPAPWVDEPEEEKLPPLLRILNANIKLDVGQQLQIQYEMENFPDGTVLEWESRNPQVAAVDPYGVVVAYSPGRAEVYVTAQGITSSVLVTVNDLKASRISLIVGDDVTQLGPRSYEVTVGEVIRVSAVIEPQGAKVEKISWLLGNENVASITPMSQTCEFVPEAVGDTQLTVTADGLVDAVTIKIVESGIPMDQIKEIIVYVIIAAIIIIVLAVVLTWLSQKRKKEKARQKAAAAKRRKEEATRRAREREEAERRAHEEAAELEMQREKLEPRIVQTETRTTQKISGAAVGASVSAPKDPLKEPDIPVTLDDLD